MIQLKVSQLIWWGAILVFGIGIYDQIQVRKNLDPGACPLDGHRAYFFISIFLILLSISVEYFEKRAMKRQEK